MGRVVIDREKILSDTRLWALAEGVSLPFCQFKWPKGWRSRGDPSWDMLWVCVEWEDALRLERFLSSTQHKPKGVVYSWSSVEGEPEFNGGGYNIAFSEAENDSQ